MYDNLDIVYEAVRFESSCVIHCIYLCSSFFFVHLEIKWLQFRLTEHQGYLLLTWLMIDEDHRSVIKINWNGFFYYLCLDCDSNFFPNIFDGRYFQLFGPFSIIWNVSVYKNDRKVSKCVDFTNLFMETTNWLRNSNLWRIAKHFSSVFTILSMAIYWIQFSIETWEPINLSIFKSTFTSCCTFHFNHSHSSSVFSGCLR